MWEMGTSADPAAAAALVVVSFVCCIAGAVLRRWPDRVRDLVGIVDGSILHLTRDAHLVVVRSSAWALSFLSVAALVAAAAVL